jgi:hypothetical protein
LIGAIRQSDEPGRGLSLADQTAAAHDVPDQEGAECRNSNESGPQQGGDGPTQSRSRLWPLVQNPPQPAPGRFTPRAMFVTGSW